MAHAARGPSPIPIPTSPPRAPAQNVGGTGAGWVQGGAQAPCTPWLQGADPWSRSRALPVVQSITSTTSTTTPALPAGNTCAGRSERGNPPPVPSRPAGRKRCRAQQWQRPTGCACASSPCSTAAPWHGTAPHGRAVPVALGSSLVHLWQGPGAATLGLSPDGISPALRGSPLRILQAAPLAHLVPGRRPQALFAPQAVFFPDSSCRRCQETPAPPRCSSAMSQEVFLPPGPAGCKAPAGSCHLCPAAGALVPPQPRGPGGPHAARPVLHCPALLSSPLLLGHNGQAPSAQHRARGAASPPVTLARGRTGWLCRGGSRAHAALGHAESKRQNHSPTASS